MKRKSKSEYPYESREAVESLGTKLDEICPSPKSGAIVLSHSPLLDAKKENFGTSLPGSVRIIESNLAFMPDPRISLTSLTSSTYLFIRAIKSIGAANIVLYMPVIPLDRKLPPVVAIEDHISMVSHPPHVGVQPADWEEQFFPMNSAYDAIEALRAMEIAKLPLASGTLLGVGVGQLDTVAGQEAAKRMGAHLISVHIFGQCLVAKRSGMRVIGFAETSGIDPEIIGGLLGRVL